MDDDRLIESQEPQEDIDFDEDHTEEEEDEYDDDEEEEEDEDEDEDEEDYEEVEVEELIPAETTSSRFSTGGSNECVGKPGKQKNEGGDERKKDLSTSEVDVCPICFQAWTSAGDHRICCLPCGHIYGMLCIKKWLLRCPGSGKCPLCKRLCTLKDVIVLYATRLSVANEELHKASSSHFPLTEAGFSAFQQFVCSWIDDTRQRIDALEQRMNFLERTFNDYMGRAQENTR